MAKAESPESKMAWLDPAFESLAVYLSSAEGKMWFNDVENLMQRIETHSKFEAVPETSLTPAEKGALAFIRSQSKKRPFPGVRKIARSAGLKSSRSGLKLLQSLKAKGLLLT
jgi:hypothetical protein